jgi:hypothetical protein
MREEIKKQRDTIIRTTGRHHKKLEAVVGTGKQPARPHPTNNSVGGGREWGRPKERGRNQDGRR